MASRKMGIAVVATLLMAGTAIAANDSTSVEEVDVPWQPPSYAATAGSANTAAYANNAGRLGGKAEGQLDVATSGQASYVPSAGVTGLPTCASGFVLRKTSSGFLCVDTVANATSATTAGNGVSGVSGSNLNLANGTSYTLPSGGGGGGACSFVFSSCTQSMSCDIYTQACTGTSVWRDTTGCTNQDPYSPYSAQCVSWYAPSYN